MKNLVEYSNSVSFTIDSDKDVVQEAVEIFSERISALKPRTIRQTGNKVFYTAGVMRLVLNANLLYGISEGELRIEQRNQILIVHYVIRFYELIALSVIPAVGALVIIDSIMGKAIGILLVLCVSYGANVLLTILRYKRFIKTTVTEWLSEKNSVPMSEEQKEWIENLNKCNACGFVISVADKECPDCGLRLQ
jgi:hypothetical protein